jgi:hypothetical protein
VQRCRSAGTCCLLLSLLLRTWWLLPLLLRTWWLLMFFHSRGRCCLGRRAPPVCSIGNLSRLVSQYRWIPQDSSIRQSDAHHRVLLRLETGFELSCSWLIVSCYGPSTNRSSSIFMKGSKLTSGHRISTVFNGQKYLFKMAKSKFLDKYFNPS